jgi:hypothetical protein
MTGLVLDQLRPLGIHNVAGLGLQGSVLCCPPPPLLLPLLLLLLLACALSMALL